MLYLFPSTPFHIIKNLKFNNSLIYLTPKGPFSISISISFPFPFPFPFQFQFQVLFVFLSPLLFLTWDLSFKPKLDIVCLVSCYTTQHCTALLYSTLLLGLRSFRKASFTTTSLRPLPHSWKDRSVHYPTTLQTQRFSNRTLIIFWNFDRRNQLATRSVSLRKALVGISMAPGIAQFWVW